MKKILAYILCVAISGAMTSVAFAQNEHQGQELYQNGHYEKAIEHWEVAAAQGDSGAAYKLGETYYDGIVVERDLKLSFKYIKQAADANDPRGLTDLAGLYDYGEIVREDKNKAAALYLAAAKQGYPSAMFNVAGMLEIGEGGLKKDKVEAYKYYLLSRDQGFAPFAVKALQDLEKNMTAKQLADAKDRADNFFATH